MNIYQPYTYLIGWSNLNIWYYGVRWAKKCNPSDLWKSYFTSSKYVKEFRDEYGEPDIIQIRKVFTTKELAKLWEDRVIARMNLSTRSDFLNRSNNNSFRGIARFKNRQIPWNKGVSGVYTRTEETKTKMREAHKGQVCSEEHKAKISAKNKGRVLLPLSDEIKAKISDSLTGKSKGPMSEEHKAKLSIINKGKTLSQETKDKIRIGMISSRAIRKQEKDSSP